MSRKITFITFGKWKKEFYFWTVIQIGSCLQSATKGGVDREEEVGDTGERM